ncbi:uncharacterized protein, partial [Fopius arisanus]|uniref:Uncharacterized protein n=1 Tax=Fopius arisanus TaxID=64838 RepID=A0A9R1TR80_9HYME
MQAETNNGYLRTNPIPNSIPKNAALLPPDEHEMPHTTTLQVTCTPRGNTTTTIVLPQGNSRRIPGITRATSVTRPRRGPTNRQQLVGVLAVTLLAAILLALLLLALNRGRECMKDTRPKICLTQECIKT